MAPKVNKTPTQAIPAKFGIRTPTINDLILARQSKPSLNIDSSSIKRNQNNDGSINYVHAKGTFDGQDAEITYKVPYLFRGESAEISITQNGKSFTGEQVNLESLREVSQEMASFLQREIHQANLRPAATEPPEIMHI